MLEVGCANGPHGKGDPGLTLEETRTHFGAWCIVSSPLTLSHDINNKDAMDRVWPIIANPEAIAVNQEYYGFSGSKFNHLNSHALTFLELDASSWSENKLLQTDTFLYLYKPMSLDHSKIAVLLINTGNVTQDLSLNFSEIPVKMPSYLNVKARNIWTRSDIPGLFNNSIVIKGVAGHDAAFLMLTTSNVVSPTVEEQPEIRIS